MSGWIVPAEQRKVSPNCWRAGSPRVAPIEGIVFHYTGSYAGAVSWLTSKTSQASAHFVVGKGGRIAQLVSLDDRAFHAGGTAARPSTFLEKHHVNASTWGIEMENLGPLTIARPGVFVAPDGKPWDPYPEEQIAAVLRLTAELVALMPHAAEVRANPSRYLVGHEHVDPGRKQDPGRAWDPIWPRVYAAAKGMC